MDIEFDTQKSAIYNLSKLFERIKQAKAKRQRICEQIKLTESELKSLSQNSQSANISKTKQSKSSSCAKNKTKWWSQYRFFETSNGFRVVAGKNAKQNDELYAKQLNENDLFFHADIQGAPATILKDAKNAKDEDMIQTAQWAGAFSSAWKIGVASVDVYCVEKSQLSKHSSGGYIGRGAFAISSERKWFRKTPLKLKLGFYQDSLLILPSFHPLVLERQVFLTPGGEERESVAKVLSALLSCKMDLLLQILPSGKISYSKN